MAALLKDLLQNPGVPKARESVDAALAKVIGIVSQQSDIDFHNYKTSTLLRRIGAPHDRRPVRDRRGLRPVPGERSRTRSASSPTTS